MSKTYTDTQLRQLMQLAHQRRVVSEAQSHYVALANEAGELLYVNEAFGRRYRCEPMELVGRNLLDLVLPAERDALRSQIAAVLSTHQMVETASRVSGPGLDSAWVSWQNSRVIGPAGERWLYSVGRDLERDVEVPGKGRYALSVNFSPLRFEDAAAPQAPGHAERDPLTGLLDRAGLQGFLAAQCAAGEGQSLAVIYVHLDHQGKALAAPGCLDRDALLLQFSQRLQSVVRLSDAVARLGAREFAVALSQVRDPAHARSVADKVRAVATFPFDLGRGALIELGARVGIALDVGASQDWLGLIERAEARVHAAPAAA